MKFSQYNIEIEKNEQYVVLYNTYKGSAIKIDLDTYQNFMENMDNGHPCFEALRSNGFIVSNEVDEYAQVRHELNLDINNPIGIRRVRYPESSTGIRYCSNQL